MSSKELYDSENKLVEPTSDPNKGTSQQVMRIATVGKLKSVNNTP